MTSLGGFESAKEECKWLKSFCFVGVFCFCHMAVPSEKSDISKEPLAVFSFFLRKQYDYFISTRELLSQLRLRAKEFPVSG